MSRVRRFPRPLQTRVLLRLLWLCWGACAVLLAVGLLLGYAAQCQTVQMETLESMSRGARKVGSEFRILYERESNAILGLRSAFQRRALTDADLSQANNENAPLCHFLYADAKGHPLAGSLPVPDWIETLTQESTDDSVTWLHPVPPLMNLTSLSRGPLPTLPPVYLVAALRSAKDGRLLALVNDTDYLLRPWLEQRVREAGVMSNFSGVDAIHIFPVHGDTHKPDTPSWGPPDASFRVLGPAPDTSMWGSLKAGLFGLPVWRFRIPTLFTDSPYPFDEVEMNADISPALGHRAGPFRAALAVGIVALALFGLALWLSEGALTREMAYAEARTRFTNMVSHELKSPVAALCMYTEMLELAWGDPEKTRTYYRTMRVEAERLRQLVDNVLAFGQVERGARTFELQRENLNDLVEEAIRRAAFEPPSREVLRQTLSEDEPMVRVDREAAIGAISNVVHNALKYGGSPPQIEVVTRQTDTSAVVEVLDRGPGIPADQRKTIFEPYVRLANDATRHIPGTGLGLALVRIYMEQQSGTVDVDSRPEGGSIFRLTFQRHKEAKA